MALWSRNLFYEMDALRREMDRVFRDFDGWSVPFFRAAFLPGRAARQYPLINLNEDRDAYYVEALAPGIDPASLNVSVSYNTVTLSGEKPASRTDLEPDAFHRNERAAGRFVRTIDLPDGVDESKVAANYKNGVLLITLPKSERAKPKQIAVKIG